jgi:HK97 family phage prohead protease
MTLGLLEARVKASPVDAGGFTAIASTGQVDRDGEVIQPNALAPLPDSVPIHADHEFSVSKIVARGRPYYQGKNLMIDGRFATTPDAQLIRQKVRDGVIDSMSIVFRGIDWKDINGVRTCVKGSLFACDLVSVPSNPGARILSTRSAMDRLPADELMIMARAQLLLAQGELKVRSKGPNRRRVDALLRSLAEDQPTRDEFRFDGRPLNHHIFNMGGPQ